MSHLGSRCCLEVVKIIAEALMAEDAGSEEAGSESASGQKPNPLQIFKYFQDQALSPESEDTTPFQRVIAFKTWSLLAGVAKRFSQVSLGLDHLSRSI